MKHCRVCAKQYTDETLRFCLEDGNPLTAFDDAEPPTLLFEAQKPAQITIPVNSEPTLQYSAPPATTPQSEKKSGLPLILAALFGLLVLAAIGIGIFFFIKPFGGSETTSVANNSANPNAKINAATDDQSRELQEKLANLERQLQDQKNQKQIVSTQRVPNSPTAPTHSTPNNSQSATAKVKPTGDGFLSLRTEPNVKTGTQLVKIPSGATVKLENCEKNVVNVDGKRGRWCMVSYNGETGWAFDAWLAY